VTTAAGSSVSTTTRATGRHGTTAGATARWSSTSISGTAVSSGRYTYVGPETLTVGGRKVVTAHFRQHRILSGSQAGTQDSELWFAPDGLPVKNERKITVDSGSIVGTVTYTERASFALASLTPHT
jgi:hypothetical protein